MTENSDTVDHVYSNDPELKLLRLLSTSIYASGVAVASKSVDDSVASADRPSDLDTIIKAWSELLWSTTKGLEEHRGTLRTHAPMLAAALISGPDLVDYARERFRDQLLTPFLEKLRSKRLLSWSGDPGANAPVSAETVERLTDAMFLHFLSTYAVWLSDWHKDRSRTLDHIQFSAPVVAATLTTIHIDQLATIEKRLTEWLKSSRLVPADVDFLGPTKLIHQVADLLLDSKNPKWLFRREP